MLYRIIYAYAVTEIIMGLLFYACLTVYLSSTVFGSLYVLTWLHEQMHILVADAHTLCLAGPTITFAGPL